MEDNLESLENLKANLAEYGRDIDTIPIIFQWNKRDLPTALPVEELQAKLNTPNAPTFDAVASTGEGVFPTLKALASLVLESINREKKDSSLSSAKVNVAPPAGAVAAARGTATRTGAATATATRTARKVPVKPVSKEASRPAARPQRRAEPAGRPVNRPMGKVQIKERTDSTRLMVSMVIAVVIVAAIGFLAWKFLGK